MRTLLLSIILISSMAVKAQTILPLSFMDYVQRENFGNSSHTIASSANKKWFLNSYSGISAGFGFFNGGNASIVSAPVGLQLNRRLNDNLYAFAAVSVAPSYINFNHPFLNSDISKVYQNNGLFRSNNLGAYSRAELGLMYINDAKTFSISGSVSVQQGNFPVYPYRPVNGQNRATPLNK